MQVFLKLVTIVAVAAACLVGLGFVAAFQLNVFERYPAGGSAVCAPVVGLPGVEDMAADHVSGIVWLSSMDRRAAADDETVRGRIVAFDPENPLDTSSWRDRTSGLPAEFAPLGVSFFRDEETTRLFVVNQAKAEILVYDVDAGGDLTLAMRPLASPALTTPNSVVAVGPSAFYVSNTRPGGFDGPGSSLDFLRRAANGSVHYYDGNSWSVAVTGLRYANGLATNADHTVLYVAETSAKTITTFQRNLQSGALTRVDETQLDIFPDNLNLTGENTLLIAGLPKPLAFAGHVAEEDKQAPSQIIAKTAIAGGLGQTTQVLHQNDGEVLSAATVAAQIGRKLLIGAFLENKFLLCDGA